MRLADQGYLQEGDLVRLNALAADIGNMIGGLMKYLRSSGYKGTKFKSAAKREG
jgi:hypothetical protein